MKKAISFLMILFMFALSGQTAYAHDDMEKISAESVFTDEIKDFLSENGITSFDFETLLNIPIENVINYILDCIKSSVKKPIFLCYSIFLIMLAVAFLSGMSGGILNSELDKSLSMVGVLTVCAIYGAPILTCLYGMKSVIEKTAAFIKIFVPSFASVMIASGKINTGIGFQTVMVFAAESVTFIISDIITPLLFLCLAFAIIGKASGETVADNLFSTVKSAILWTLTITMTLFVSIVTLKGIIASDADSFALKTGKFFAGNFIPIVGNALSEAASSVQGGMQLIKSTSGVLGIIVIMLYIISPITEILIYKAVCDITSAVGNFIGIKSISDVLHTISEILGTVTAIILSFAAVFIISIAVTIKLGGGT